MKKGVVLAALFILVLGTSCSLFSKAEREINKAAEETEKATEEIEELSKELEEVEEELSKKFDDNADKTIGEPEGNTGALDDSSKQSENPDQKDLSFDDYDSVYMGTWTTQQAFSAPITMMISGETVTGFAEFYKAIPGGQSTSTIQFNGTIDFSGNITGTITGSGVLSGDGMASTMSMRGDFSGSIEGDMLLISYNSSAETYIKNYGAITNTDGGTIVLNRVTRSQN